MDLSFFGFGTESAYNLSEVVMSVQSRLILRTLFFLILCSCAMAKTTNKKTNVQEAAPGTATAPAESPLSGLFGISRSTSLNDFKDGTRKDGIDYELRAAYSFAPNYSIGTIAGYSQDLKNSAESDFANTSVTVRRKGTPWGSYLVGGYGFGVNLPTSKKSSQGQSLYLGTSASIVLDVNPEKLATGLEIKSSVSLTKNFHNYNTAQDGSVNSSWSSLQLIGFQYSLPIKLGASLTVIHRNSLSYQDVLKDSFELTEEIFYSINQTFTVSIGHTNAGSSLKPNATDSNVQIVDEKNSLVYLGLALGF
jgi:hypothetical protein